MRDARSLCESVHDRVYYPGIFRSSEGDYPAGLPGQTSAFVSATITPENVFLMQLDVAAPIVHVAENDIAVAEGTPVTLSAGVGPGATAYSVIWYEANQPIAAGGSVELVLSPGRHQISAIATDDQGRIGMAGVVVNVGTYTSTDTPKSMADAHPSKGAGLPWQAL